MTPDRLFRFVQFEFAWPLGPDDGRYLLRDHAGEDAHHVLVFAAWPTIPQRRSRRWGRELEPQNIPAETGLSRATLVETTVVDEEQAHRELQALDEDAAQQAIAASLRILNGALRAFRAAAADPVLREVTAEQALTLRIGYGQGVEVADGAWTEARDFTSPAPKGKRRPKVSALRPHERFAALLGGRDAVLACEELALRGRLDLDQDRPREAALQVHLAIEAALAELVAFRGTDTVGRRLDDLEQFRDPLARAASEALQGGPSAATIATVTEALQKLEATLRARSASATY